jgi:hypothetical protein
MSLQEIQAELEALSSEERKKLAAFLVSLRHRELAGYRARMSRMIDDQTPGNWLTVEELDQRVANP